MEERQKLTEKPGYYAIIPADVRYDKSISANAKLLYGEITCLLNFNARCFATNAYFSRLYELSESQISRLITQLVTAEHITIKMENKASGMERIIGLPLRKNADGGVRKNAEGGVRKNAYHNKHSININTISEDIVNALFVDFWNLYGLKKGLKEAFKSWNKISTENHKIILQKLPAWLKQKSDSGEIVPYPATFLNQERWNDEISSLPPMAVVKTAVAETVLTAPKKVIPFNYSAQTQTQNAR